MKELHSPKSNTYRLVDGTELIGPAMIDEESITVQTAEGIKTAPRDQLDAIIEHTQRERNYWSTVLRFGLTAAVPLRAGQALAARFDADTTVTVRRPAGERDAPPQAG